MKRPVRGAGVDFSLATQLITFQIFLEIDSSDYSRRSEDLLTKRFPLKRAKNGTKSIFFCSSFNCNYEKWEFSTWPGIFGRFLNC